MAAELLTSEIVTNAVIHPRPLAQAGGQGIVVHLHRTSDWVRVEVIDRDPQLPQPAIDPPEDLGRGWGLHLLNRLATSWGVHPVSVGVGKAVWFEIRTYDPPLNCSTEAALRYGFGHALRFWVEAVVGDGWGTDPVAVAKCAHCDDVVFSVDGGWVMADMTRVDPVDGAPLRRSRIRHFSTVRAVLDAMDAHHLPD